jgi:dTDP-4-amino-4,6-dideoxygalactose transaminase
MATVTPAEIALADPGIGEAERVAVDRVMRSGWISLGPETAAFEAELAAAHGMADAVAVNSGTAALHLALAALEIGPGDEVIVPSLTFVATAAAALMVGARPVFADIVGPDDLTLDPSRVEAACTARTRAVVVVHYGGWAARIGELRDLTDAAGLALVEDTAHAPLTTGPAATGMLGTIGDVGCFSFHAAKNLTCGEGGMVVARDPAVLARVRALRSHAFTAPPGAEAGAGGAATRDIPELGFNYRPTDLTSAIGRVQLARLEREIAARRALTADYRRRLDEAGPAVTLPFPPEGPSAHHLLPILLPPGTDRPRLQADLRDAGIQTAVHFPPIHRYSTYRDAPVGPGGLARTEDVTARLLSLPLHGRLTTSDVDRVVAILSQALVSAGPSPERHAASGRGPQ